ncbi:MAG: DNA-binding protein, partial [Alphaproteobacteria bacterium]
MNVQAVIPPGASVAAPIDMQRIYAARELADLKIPGAPITQQGIKRMARRENWRFVKRSGRGGGEGYPITALPPAWQAAILRGDKFSEQYSLPTPWLHLVAVGLSAVPLLLLASLATRSTRLRAALAAEQ